MKKRGKKVMISGYYGFGNMGDEAILAAIVKALKSQSPDLEIVVLSNTPRQNLPHFRTVGRKNLLGIVRELLDTDLFISGGGGLIQDTTGVSTIDYYLGLVLLAKAMGKKVMFYAQGVGPINTEKGRRHARLISNKVDFITVRDEESRNILQGMGVSKPPIIVTCDPVLALQPAAPERISQIIGGEKISEDSLKIGISIRPWKCDIDYAGIIAEIADRLIEAEKSEIILIPFQRSQDREVCARVKEAMKGSAVLLEGSYSPEELQGLMGRMDLIIGMRLHSLIFGSTQGVPMVGIAYDPKVKIFSELMGIPSVDLSELSLERILEMIREINGNREMIKRMLHERVVSLEGRALKTARIAVGLIDGKPVRALEEES